MKSADKYAEMAEDTLAVSRIATGHVALAQIYATLAGAAATLEAARLMGPTPEDQARLDALRLSVEDQYAPYYCSREWVDEEASVPGDVNALPGEPNQHDGKPHRCVYTLGHEKDDPHYCRCGSEL